jgi:hypothetical protein
MDIEEIIIEALRLAEQIELEHGPSAPPHIYTCIVKATGGTLRATNVGMFSDVVLTGELCVCAHSEQVALLIFFLIHGIFDYGDNRLEWYTQILEGCINIDYDDVTAELVMQSWTKWYYSVIEIKEHNIAQPIVVYPILCDTAAAGTALRGVVTLTPSICDIWTLPRIRRQFTD